MTTYLSLRRPSRNCILAAAGLSVLFASLAAAQPAGVIDLGDVGIGATMTSGDRPIAPAATVWFRFHLTTPITPVFNWLELDSGRSSINTEFALYDAHGNLVAQDDSSGGAASANSTSNFIAAGLSFGSGSGGRVASDMPSWFGGRISDGFTSPTLQEGVYYVAVTGYNASFPDPNVTWSDPSTNSTATGTVRCRVSTGSRIATSWNERHHGADGGSTPATAIAVEGAGPLTSLLAVVGNGGQDLFKIDICDPAHFLVTATPTADWGNTFRARMYIFDSTGRGVVAINNTSVRTTTSLTLPAGTPAGTYFVAITNYCGGYIAGIDYSPYDASDRKLWEFTNNNNVRISPNGPGAASPMAYFGRGFSDCEMNSSMTFRMDFQGACFVSGSSAQCPADFNNDGIVDFFDYLDFVASFSGGC
jgi:hypothetical protein